MQKTLYFIDVILPIPLERLFTYSVTKAEYEFLEKGMRVAVPFGKSKIYTAIVFNFHQNPPEKYQAKDITLEIRHSGIIIHTNFPNRNSK